MAETVMVPDGTGKQAPRRVVPPEIVDAMRADWLDGMRQVDIAAKYGVSQGLVSKKVGGSPAVLAAEIRRLRRAIGDYFTTAPTEERDRLLWNALHPEDT